MKLPAHNSIDEYLADVDSVEMRASLNRIRAIVRDEVPDAVEVISYGMPGFKLNGYLVGFAAFKNHCSLFPGAIVDDFLGELSEFKTSKGTIQFSPDNPVPEALVRKIVRTKAASLWAKAKR